MKTAKEITNYCNKQLSHYKVPAYYLFLKNLPTTGTQKLKKQSLINYIYTPMVNSKIIDTSSYKRKLGKNERYKNKQ